MAESASPSLRLIALIFLRLGLTAFGGPAAHLSYFYREFVQQRAWLTADDYRDLVALCQFLPGPSSSQTGFGIGLLLGGWRGAWLAFICFTMPTAVLMAWFGYFVMQHGDSQLPWLLQSLLWLSAAVIADAVWSMARQWCLSWRHVLILPIGLLCSLWPSVWLLPGGLLLGAMFGMFWFAKPVVASSFTFPPSLQSAALTRTLVALLLGLVLVATTQPWTLDLIISGFRSGSLVVGGGHLLLPLLQREWLAWPELPEAWLVAGYGAVQALPGPIFSMGAYVGSLVAQLAQAPIWQGAWLGVLSVFLPGFMLLSLCLPIWWRWRQQPRMQAAMAGIGVVVVGLLAGAWWHMLPLWAHSPHDWGMVLLCYVIIARQWLSVPQLAVVLLGWNYLIQLGF